MRRPSKTLEQQWETARIKLRQSEASAFILAVDEIQKIPNWSETVKANWDADTRANLPLKVVLLGSSRLLLQQGLTESLVGRFELSYIGHWSLKEMQNESFLSMPIVFLGNHACVRPCGFFQLNASSTKPIIEVYSQSKNGCHENNMDKIYTSSLAVTQSTGFLSDFPNTTHSFFNPILNGYEMMELTDDDLFASGIVKYDQNNQPELFDYFLTLCPLPVDWGLSFEGITTIEYTDDPDVDSTIYHQYYDVVAFGTLNTYDDGPQEGLKLLFTEKITDFKDGVSDVFSYDEIVWYTKDGHYIRGTLAPGAPKVGPTTFEFLEYHKVVAASSATHEQQFGQLARKFPNPVSAGQVLTVQLPNAVESGNIEVMNMQGIVVSTLSLNTVGKNNEFNIQVPPNLPSGIYTYRIFSQNAVLLGSGKVQVQ